ncbi:Uncharacterized protein C10orf131-like [Cricetulus griseus]|uniref:Uncharacterized protein C10orf131-like n=1 Tax=Cricetulus griseus TaxID=10029 RepID=G3GZU1_CRIGR|nr:Uncharacterized protein C10orf131-like [Cricetulus griseus]
MHVHTPLSDSAVIPERRTENIVVIQPFPTVQTEVLLDEGLSFFILSGEEDSAVSRSAQQKSVSDSYFKPSAFGGSLQTAAEGQDEDFVEEVILMDLFEVKAAEYEDDQEQMKRQEAIVFVPSSSPVANQRKLPKGMMPRILEDEGFYIKKKPATYKKIRNKMENRLLSLQEASVPHQLMLTYDICF